MASMIANMKEKTGKSLEEWIQILAKAGLAKHGEKVNLLKGEHGLTHGYANMIVHFEKQEAAGGPPAEEDLVAGQYAGKEGLKPIYEALMAAVRGFGEGLDESPKKAYVSLRRKKQFALFQPSTASRLDVGINLKGVAVAGSERLEASGSWNAMCSHRVRLTDVSQVDAELVEWLRAAWEAAG